MYHCILLACNAGGLFYFAFIAKGIFNIFPPNRKCLRSLCHLAPHVYNQCYVGVWSNYCKFYLNDSNFSLLVFLFKSNTFSFCIFSIVSVG